MDIRGRLHYSRSIIITKDTIHEIIDVLNKLFVESKISYEIINRRDTRIEFDTLDELLQYDNYGNNSIIQLVVSCHEGYREVVSIKFERHFNVISMPIKNCVKCIYRFSDLTIEEEFRKSMMKLLRKNTSPHWVFNNVSIYYLFMIANWIYCIYIMLRNPGVKFSQMNAYLGIGAVISLAFLGFVMYIDYIFKKWLPKVVFCFGEEAELFNRRESILSKLFWTVLVGGIVSIFTSLITRIW